MLLNILTILGYLYFNYLIDSSISIYLFVIQSNWLAIFKSSIFLHQTIVHYYHRQMMFNKDLGCYTWNKYTGLLQYILNFILIIQCQFINYKCTDIWWWKENKMSRANKEFIGEVLSHTGTSICLMLCVTLIVLNSQWSIEVLAMSGLLFLVCFIAEGCLQY